MKKTEEKYCLCALNRIFGFEPKVAHALLSHVGSASALFSMSAKDIDMLMGPWSKYKGTICPRALDEAAEEIERLKAGGIRFLGHSEDGYPGLLSEC